MALNMKHSQDILPLVESFEGCSLRAYHGKNDPLNVFTLGWGHTSGVKKGDEITLMEAYQLLNKDLEESDTWVNRCVRVDLTQHEFDALSDFCFNVGGPRFQGSTMLKLLNMGKYHEAADEFEKWSLASGVRMAGLLRRRKAEHDLFEQG